MSHNKVDFSEFPWEEQLWQEIGTGGNLESFWIPTAFFAILKGKLWCGHHAKEFWHEGGKPKEWKHRCELEEMRRELAELRTELANYKNNQATQPLNKTKEAATRQPKPMKAAK